MRAAARGEPYRIVHGGSSPLNHAGDVARLFVRAARASSEGAAVYDAGGPVHHMREVVAAIVAAVPSAGDRLRRGRVHADARAVRPHDLRRRRLAAA